MLSAVNKYNKINQCKINHVNTINQLKRLYITYWFMSDLLVENNSIGASTTNVKTCKVALYNMPCHDPKSFF